MDCPREVKNLYVTSSNRDISKNPYGNSYTLYLTTPIKDITTVELLYAAIPNTMYNLNNGSDVIGFTNINDPPAIIPVTIPPGFYGANGICNEIMNATYTASNVAVSFLTNEGRFLFTQYAPFDLEITTPEMAALLGFEWGNPTFITATAASDTVYATNLRYINRWFIKSQHVVDMNAYDGIFLDIQELRTTYNECTPQGAPYSNMNNAAPPTPPVMNTQSGNFNSTANRSFGLIPMDVISGTIKRFKKENDFDNQVHYPYPIQKLDRLTISWTDKNGNLLSFNGAEDNSFILRFYTLRKNLC